MMKRIACLLVATSLLGLSACTAAPTTESTAPTATPTEAAAPMPSPTDTQLDTTQTLDKIAVTMELDEATSQAIVTISNESVYIFDGPVSVYFKDTQGGTCANDMIFVEELTPGNFTYARINLENTSVVQSMEYKIGNSATFVPAPSSEGGELDEETTQQLAADFEGGFGGAGNPEYATSWYHYVVSVEVFVSQDGKNALITVSDDATEEAIDRIGNTVFANYTKDYNIVSVEVETESGERVFTRTW